jgi:hypothetical protein
MKWSKTCALFLCLLSGQASGSSWPNSAGVTPRGESEVGTSSGGNEVRVRVRTHEVDIGKPSDPRPARIDSNCTYSRHPCSVVDGISIEVGRESLFVPRSVFSDLADLTRMDIRREKGYWTLTLYGGDASESYVVRVEFDGTRVFRRALSTALLPDGILQETRYFVQSVGD